MENNSFLIKTISNADWEKELEIIGFDKSYIHKATDKFLFKNLKIYNLTTPQANILKQTALSVGADCATNKEVITGKIENSDAILSGSYSQLNKIAEKLKFQPFGLKLLSDKILQQLSEKKNKTKIIGILNITSNSFSDGGKYNSTDSACEHFQELVNDGADIIDIGAESTKPGAPAIPPEKQLEKLLPVLAYIRENKYNIPISIDTRSAIVAEECLKQGASIINDVSGLKYDENMISVLSKTQATLILQHSLGNEKNMMEQIHSKNIVDDVFIDINNQIQKANNAGINDIIIDVGIGFDKSREDSFRLLNRIDEFFALGYPVMTGISRKSILNIPDSSNDEKDVFTLALNTLAIEHHIDYLRVHNVKLHKKLIEIYQNSLI